MMEQNKIWESFHIKAEKESPRCLAVNTVLAGKYLVGPVLGEGGFGITYAGYDLNMETKIAIKEYFPVELVTRDTTRRPADGSDPSDGISASGGGSDRVISLSGEKSKTYQQGLKKYVDEARNVSQFSGTPGIVSVKDFFYENDTAYIVMEYIEGVSLKEYLKQKGGRLSEEEALAILRPVLEALEQVHGAGIVHRDISPDNIMLTFAGEGGAIAAVRLIDFGAARMTAKNDQKSLTIILKHGYAPEEQYRSHGEQGPWTDVYALCAVLYRMLTGKVPEPAMDRLFSDGLKRPEELGAAVSPAVSEAIMRGLAVKKDDRIQTVKELYDAFYGGKRLKQTGRTKQRRIAAGAAVAAVCVLLLTAVGIGSAGNKTASGQPAVSDRGLEVVSEEGLTAGETEGQRTQEQNGEASDPGVQAEELLSLEQETEEALGESIVSRTPQTALAAGDLHVLALHADGTVSSYGANTDGQREVEGWSHIAAVAAGSTFSAGLREDGRLMTAGALEGEDEVLRWENVIEIAASGTTLFGLTGDGQILSNRKYGTTEDAGAYYDWENVVHITCSPHGLSALTRDGDVLTCMQHSLEFGNPVRIEGWTDVKHLVAAQYAVFGITEAGDVRCGVLLDAVPEGYYDFTGMEDFHDISMLYSDAGNIQYGVREDGTIVTGGAALDPYYDMERSRPALFQALSQWKDMEGFIEIPYEQKYLGMKKDGSVVRASENYGNSTPEDMHDLAWITFLDDANILGVTRGGKALTYGTSNQLWVFDSLEGLSQAGQLSSNRQSGYFCLTQDGYLRNLESMPGSEVSLQEGADLGEVVWPGVKQMVVDEYRSWIGGLFQDGTVRLIFTKYGREIKSGLLEAEKWTDIRQIARYGGSTLFGLREDGTVQGVDMEGKEMTITRSWTDIAAIFSGPDLAAIRKDGTALFAHPADNDYGQKNVSDWRDLTQLAMSGCHTVGLKADGTVVATGSNASGQCEVEDWTDIVFVTANDNCTLGIRSDGTLAVAGEIGW